LAFPFAPTGAQASLISGPYQKTLKKSIWFLLLSLCPSFCSLEPKRAC
jgi:hypothetical protein